MLGDGNQDFAEAYDGGYRSFQTLANGREMLQFRGAYRGTIARRMMDRESRMRMKKGDERVIEEEEREKKAGKGIGRESVSAGPVASRLK